MNISLSKRLKSIYTLSVFNFYFKVFISVDLKLDYGGNTMSELLLHNTVIQYCTLLN